MHRNIIGLFGKLQTWFDGSRQDPPAPTPVLVVDDEESIRRYAERILSAAGYAPVTAPDGPTALAVAAAMPEVPVLLTDLMMPGIVGDELARALRQQDPDLKVLYMTGYADRLFAERTMLWEGEAYLDKPFTPRGLVEALTLLTTGHTPKADGFLGGVAADGRTPQPQRN